MSNALTNHESGRSTTVTRAPGNRVAGNRIALATIAVLIVAAILAPLVAPYAMDALDLTNRRAAPSLHHWFGTDELGRDLFTRVLYGARVSLAIGLGSAALSVGLGTALGVTAGYFGKWVDEALMRATDAMLCIPRLPLIMIAAAFVRPSVALLVVLVSAAGWMEAARVTRAAVQSLAAGDFVAAARASGATSWRVMFKHIVPGIVPVLAVATTIAVGRGILLESAVSFFGVGVQPPTASWGNMLYQAQTTMSSEPWLAIFPGAMIFITVLACNAVGDHLGRGTRGV